MSPSFSLFRTSRRASEPTASETVGHEIVEKEQRRQSKREFFRSLIKKPKPINTNQKSSRWRDSSSKKNSQQLQLQSPLSPDLPSTPMSYTDKPLPPPPALGSPQAEDPPPLPQPAQPATKTTKLARIISPIAPADLHRLFSGAPQFFARSEGHHTEAPHPSVVYPWNTELDIRNLSDHTQIQDEAWNCVTAWPHIIATAKKGVDGAINHETNIKHHFLPRCRERPNTLSMQGVEKGAIGFAAALEMGVADALQDPAESAADHVILDHRKRFLNAKEGLRPLASLSLIERLSLVSKAYHEGPERHTRPALELYTELFTQILYPPSRIIDSDDPYSLQVQIEALVDVLAAPLVWTDFSMVEERLRLGHFLWGPSSDTEMDGEIAINNEVMREAGTQKYWLLLQVLLSCELLVRLDAVSMAVDHGRKVAIPEEIHRFDKKATTSVKWSMILARQWLDNIKIEETESSTENGTKSSTGWLSAFTGATESASELVKSVDDWKFESRHQIRQLAGLLHFARIIGWPNMESLTAKVATNEIKVSHSTTEVPPTPISSLSQHSAPYFSSRRLGHPVYSRQRNLSVRLSSSGWLSSSYVSGLILPGESLSHVLISTLVENDELAVSKLGNQANLLGGFVYSGRSFWSVGCLVGRILAARKGSNECMGWVSSDVSPRGVREQWVEIDVEPVLSGSSKTGSKARIWHKTTIEHNGSVLGGADFNSVLPGDFVLPSDESMQKPFSVDFESLDLFAAADSEANSIAEAISPFTDITGSSNIKTYSAMMRFKLDTENEGQREINLALHHDVNFVSAHPCVSSPYNDIIRTPTSPTFQISEHSSIRSVFANTGHLLHKAFTYTRIHILDLLFTSTSTPFSVLLSPPQSPDPTQSSTHTTSSSIRKVLVIDCTDSTSPKYPPSRLPSPQPGHKHSFGSDLEMLARALCAERGWNALVSRKGRSCVACAVREVGALGWKAVLRLA
ncbi:hypothetical protein BJ875DRAFT_184516 [Amylocarpus encephaloides]|uniref:Uncharacterized protein n=1 Tax=Amylocarpus encephaloides TaxID=45428 RepID=A0A9P7YPW1_9HELO|nr:hypothetical protein BJ875DRAFT_184516 [Amylocarpus encephaloides]